MSKEFRSQSAIIQEREARRHAGVGPIICLTKEQRAVKKRPEVPHRIGDGEYATYSQMGKRLGVTKQDAEKRYQNARNRGVWPITWEALGAVSRA